MTNLAKLYLGSFLFVVLADQLSKQWAVETLTHSNIEIIPGLLNFSLAFNPGAAFSMFAGLESPWRQIVLWGVSVFAIGLIGYLFFKDYKDDVLARYSLVLILAGALGNLIDRVRLGHVVDFIDVYWNQSHFPTFNIADSAITIGAFLLIVGCGEWWPWKKR